MDICLLSAADQHAVDYTFLGGTLPMQLSFSRASAGIRFNASGGIESLTNDTPRFDYNPATLALNGLLIEEQRTNIILYSSDTTMQAQWNNSSGSPSITNNDAGAPDGSSTFNHFTRTTTAPSFRGQNVTKAAGSLPFTFTLYAKAGTNGRYVALRIQGVYPNRTDCAFDLVNGTAGTPTNAGSGFSGASSIQAIGNGLYRCTFTTSTTSTSTLMTVFYSVNSNGSSQIDTTDSASNSDGYVWGAQLEQASTATSSIPTTTASVTRATDALSFTLPNGVSKLRYFFDDNSTQDVTVSAGAYTIPTNLSRTRIKRVYSL
jgi:hypothetical protein